MCAFGTGCLPTRTEKASPTSLTGDEAGLVAAWTFEAEEVRRRAGELVRWEESVHAPAFCRPGWFPATFGQRVLSMPAPRRRGGESNVGPIQGDVRLGVRWSIGG